MGSFVTQLHPLRPRCDEVFHLELIFTLFILCCAPTSFLNLFGVVSRWAPTYGKMDSTRNPSTLAAEYSPARTSDDCSPSIHRSPGGYEGEPTGISEQASPGGYFEYHNSSPRAMENAYPRAASRSPVSATRAIRVPLTQQIPQYYRGDIMTLPVRNTRLSGVSATTTNSRKTAGSSAPMLPENIKSTFDEDAPKPHRRLILCGIKKSNFFVLLVLLVFLLVVGVGIGVGVGMGMSNTSKSSPYSKQAQYTVSLTSPATTPTISSV